jgi:hypothetical protein
VGKLGGDDFSGASRGCSCAAPLVLAACCAPTAGGLRSASVYARGLTTDLSAFASVSHPSACSLLSVQAPPRVPEGCNRPRRVHQSAPCNRQAQTFAPVFSPCPRLRLRRSAWRAARTACGLPGGLPSSPQPLACGYGWGELAGGQGRGAGRRWWVGSREKWLCVSYTLLDTIKEGRSIYRR